MFQLPPRFQVLHLPLYPRGSVEQRILDPIRWASRYAIENEAAFIQRVREEAAVRENRRKLTKGKRRR